MKDNKAPDKYGLVIYKLLKKVGKVSLKFLKFKCLVVGTTPHNGKMQLRSFYTKNETIETSLTTDHILFLGHIYKLTRGLVFTRTKRTNEI